MDRQTIWFVGLIFVFYSIFCIIDSTLAYIILVVIPPIFTCINIVWFLNKGIKFNYWDTFYIAAAILYFMLSTKLLFTFYNFLFHLLIIISGFTLIVKKNNQTTNLIDRITFLLVINLIVFLIPSISLFHYFRPADEKIWNNKIEWIDFKGVVPDNTENYGAKISSEFYWKYNKFYNTPRVLTVSVMNKSESWASAVSAKYNSNNLLNHEKIHLDITEWTRREFKDSLDNVNKLSKKNIQNIYEHFIELNKTRQDDYDNDSEHGKNSEGQKIWNEKLFKYFNE